MEESRERKGSDEVKKKQKENKTLDLRRIQLIDVWIAGREKNIHIN